MNWRSAGPRWWRSISRPQLVEIARKRLPDDLRGKVTLHRGRHAVDPTWARSTHVMAMDSLIYYDAADLGRRAGAPGRAHRQADRLHRRPAHAVPDGHLARWASCSRAPTARP